jgi:hypothetical protein
VGKASVSERLPLAFLVVAQFGKEGKPSVQLPPAKSRSFASLRMTILYDDKQTEPLPAFLGSRSRPSFLIFLKVFSIRGGVWSIVDGNIIAGG